MPKTEPIVNQRDINDYYQAAGLLLDPNLEWSSDFEAVRENLGNFLKRMADQGKVNDFHLCCLVKDLIKEENDITI
jgi:hypothetical protein